MKSYDLIVFDKDGTLLDTSSGIYFSNKSTLAQMGYPTPPLEILKGIMGPPLEYCFEDVCGIPHDRLDEAIEIYMSFYKSEGIYMMEHYPGMIDTLKKLRADGYKTAVATLKEHTFVEKILDKMDLLSYIDAYYGSSHEDGGLRSTKALLIRKCMETCGVTDPSRVLMIGDSLYDAEGAQEAGVDFLAVTYGFSIHSEQDMGDTPYVGIVSTPEEILSYV